MKIKGIKSLQLAEGQLTNWCLINDSFREEEEFLRAAQGAIVRFKKGFMHIMSNLLNYGKISQRKCGKPFQKTGEWTRAPKPQPPAPSLQYTVVGSV